VASVDANVSCSGGADGAASAEPQGGTGAVSFLWSNGATTASIIGLSVGSYSVTVTDANGCENMGNVIITEPFPISISMSGTDETDTNADGTATATSSGGTPPYTYTWSNGATGSFIFSLPAGVYTVTVTDANNCSNSGSVQIGQNISVALTVPENICLETGIQTGWTGGTPSGGVYSGPGVTDDGNGMTYTFDPIVAGPGIHIITYTFGNDNATATVEVYDTPLVSLSFPDTIAYNDGTPPSGLGGGSPEGGFYADFYNEITDDGNGMTFSFDTLVVGFNSITYTYTDQNGCTDSATENFEVVVLTDLDNPLALQLQMAPNPATSSIELSGIKMDRIDFFDTSGKLVKSLNQPPSTIGISELPKGMYFLKIKSGVDTITLRLVKE